MYQFPRRPSLLIDPLRILKATLTLVERPKNSTFITDRSGEDTESLWRSPVLM